MTTLKIMPLGDSLTRGQGDPAWNGYRADLDQRFTNLGGLTAEMIGPWTDGSGDNNHAGTSGARIDQLTVQAAQLMTDYIPDVVLLMAGTNDVAQQFDLPNAPLRLRHLIARLQQFQPTVRLYVATIPAFRDPAWKPLVDAYNVGVQDTINWFASDKVTFVPGHIVGTDPAKDLVPGDLVHLTPCGYAKLAFVWWDRIRVSSLNPGAPWSPGSWPWATTVCTAAS
jgi:lysophospholipase L1-like esterase